MKKRKPLRRNRTLRRRAPLKNTKPLKARKGLERRTPLRQGKDLKRGSGLRRRARKPSPGTREQRLAFKQIVVSRAPRDAQRRRICPVCGRLPSASNPLEAHHVTGQTTIKRVVAGMGLEPDVATERLAALLWDPVNGLAVCREDHEAHTKAVRRISRRFVTEAHRVFARALGVEHLLDRYYPV